MSKKLLDGLASLQEIMRPMFDRHNAIDNIFSPPLERRLLELGAELKYLDGNCPVQGEGKFEGVDFYFRARGERWSLHVGEGAPTWESDEWMLESEFGDGPYDAGWMDRHQALKFILDGLKRYRAYKRSLT